MTIISSRMVLYRAFAHDTTGNDVTTNFYSANQVVFEVSSF